MTNQLGTIPQDLWRQTPGNVFRTDLTAARFEELQRLRENAIAFVEICRINYGAQISSAEKGAFGRDRYLADSNAGMSNPKRFYEGSNMRPFCMMYGGYWVDYLPDIMYGPRTAAFFESDKLSVRHISGDADTFVAWVDEEHYLTDHGVIHAVPYHALKQQPGYRVTPAQAEISQRYPLFFLLGALMSRPALELYAELYATGSLQGAFSHVYPNMLKGLPIPELHRAPPDPPDNWFERLVSAMSNERLSRAGVGRALADRDEVAAVLAAAAHERQTLEFARAQREADFVAFMQIHMPGWRWPRGESLDVPPGETEFLQTVGARLISITTMSAVRTEFRNATEAAGVDAQRAALLQSMIDGTAAFLYRTSAG